MSSAAAPSPHSSYSDLSLRDRRRFAAGAILRTSATLVLVVALYFVLPLDHAAKAGAVAEVALGVLAFVAIIAWQLKRIVGPDHPISRAVEALTLSVPLYVLLFATTYFLMARANQATFGGSLSRTDAMYFSTIIFTTVGSVTSPQRPKLPDWWSHYRCGWIWCSWAWWCASW